jgi:hypothetical protein
MLQVCSALRRKHANNARREAIALELYRSGRPDKRRPHHGLKHIPYRRPENEQSLHKELPSETEQAILPEVFSIKDLKRHSAGMEKI